MERLVAAGYKTEADLRAPNLEEMIGLGIRPKLPGNCANTWGGAGNPGSEKNLTDGVSRTRREEQETWTLCR